jgi:hypothetical protein
MIEQAWEMGAGSIRLIHGHGRGRGLSPGFVNTNTGYFGVQIRRELRDDGGLRRWIKHSTLDCSDNGSTVVKLKRNPSPTGGLGKPLRKEAEAIMMQAGMTRADIRRSVRMAQLPQELHETILAEVMRRKRLAENVAINAVGARFSA